MKCQILFSRKHKKNISKCHLLKFLPSMQSFKGNKHSGSREAALSKLFLPPFWKSIHIKMKLFSFRVDPFSEGDCCVGKQTGSHKSCLPCKKWQKIKCTQFPKFIGYCNSNAPVQGLSVHVWPRPLFLWQCSFGPFHPSEAGFCVFRCNNLVNLCHSLGKFSRW